MCPEPAQFRLPTSCAEAQQKFRRPSAAPLERASEPTLAQGRVKGIVLGTRRWIDLHPAFARNIGFDPGVRVHLPYQVVIADAVVLRHMEATDVPGRHTLQPQQDGGRTGKVLAVPFFFSKRNSATGCDVWKVPTFSVYW